MSIIAIPVASTLAPTTAQAGNAIYRRSLRAGDRAPVPIRRVDDALTSRLQRGLGFAQIEHDDERVERGFNEAMTHIKPTRILIHRVA